MFVGGATAKVQVLRFAQDDGVGRLGLMEVVGSESIIMYQAAFNFFPNVKPLCIVILSEAKDLDVCIENVDE